MTEQEIYPPDKREYIWYSEYLVKDFYLSKEKRFLYNKEDLILEKHAELTNGYPCAIYGSELIEHTKVGRITNNNKSVNYEELHPSLHKEYLEYLDEVHKAHKKHVAIWDYLTDLAKFIIPYEYSSILLPGCPLLPKCIGTLHKQQSKVMTQQDFNDIKDFYSDVIKQLQQQVLLNILLSD